MRDMHPHLEKGKDYVEPIERWTPVETVVLVLLPAVGRWVRRGWHKTTLMIKGPTKR